MSGKLAMSLAPSLAAALDQGWLEFEVKLPRSRPWVDMRTAAAAIGRVNAAGEPNSKFLINLVDSGELTALNTKLPGQVETSRRFSTLSVHRYCARNITMDPQGMAFQFRGLIRDLAENLPLDLLEQELREVARLKAERLAQRESLTTKQRKS